MSNVFYYDYENNCRCSAAGIDVTRVRPAIACRQRAIWQIHVRYNNYGVLSAVDLSDATAWRAAVDVDFDRSAGPCCRTLNADIDSSAAAGGDIAVTLDADTDTFQAALGVAESVNAYFELVGFDAAGRQKYYFRFPVSLVNVLDPAPGETLSPVGVYYDKTEVDALVNGKAAAVDLAAHQADTNNPHAVTKAQIGLASVDNTADANKPVSAAQQAALDAKASVAALTAHEGDTDNPHAVTKAQIGLASVDNTADANKPVSAAQQTALDAKASVAALTAHEGDTDNPHAVTATQVGKDTAQWNADKLQGANIAATSPADGQALIYRSANSRYEPGTPGAVASVFGKTGAVANIADTAGYLYNDGSGNFSYTAPSGSGDVTGPTSSTDGHVAVFNGTTGKAIKDSGLALSGTNTGDETASTIKTKLGAATDSVDGYLSAADHAAFAAKMANPMTAAGDIIYGGTSGAATRLAKGSDGQALVLASGVPSWGTVGGGAITDNPQTADYTQTATGQQIRYTSATAAARTLTLMSPPANGSSPCYVRNESVNVITLSGAINGSASATFALASGCAAQLVSDGTYWRVARLVDNLPDISDAVAGKPVITASSLVSLGGLSRWTLNNVLTDAFGSRELTNSGLSFATDSAFPLGTRSVLACDGSNYLSFTPTGLPSGASARTVCCWIKTTATNGPGFFTWGAYSAGQLQSFALTPGGYLCVAGHSSGYSVDATSGAVNDGNWHFVAYTFDGTTCRIYRDGTQVVTGTPSWNTGTSSGVVGIYGTSWTDYRFSGRLADIRVYNRALSASELSTVYAGDAGTTWQLSASAAARNLAGRSATAPTVAAGSGAGTSPTVSVEGSDASGKISVTTGTGPTASATVATVTFASTMPNTPYCVLTHANAAAAALSGNAQVYATTTTSTLTITVGSTALAASTAYAWYYHVL